MSIVMDRVEQYGFDLSVGSIFPADPPAKIGGAAISGGVDRWLSPFGSWASSSPSSSLSSSIGRDSDEEDGGKPSPEGGYAGENEAESEYRGPLDTMDCLEEVLPIRRGISKFFNGKSKSFTSLAETSSSIKDIRKPENPYSRRRRNLLSHHLWNHKNHRGISKKPITNTSKSSMGLALAAAAEEKMPNSGEDSSSGSMLPPLRPWSKGSFGNFSPPETKGSGGGLCTWRSYSVADLPRSLPATVASGGSGES
ncbi:PREDICTED: uncharacterized protein LOC104815089 [Tarenaya hassleriana]|uniref:uncharacterized protein LOC104815089 n=1 Tax=Tarenaya hassleriana TaxID=28532 RepID=UPI00053C8749|nr:PREDICTED: uncharacterized protein LOC104815089 [Tarenaya hassleriana]